MSEEKKYSLDEVEDLMSRESEEQNFFSFPNLFATFVLNWQWFLLTVFICLCGAFIYLRYATPQYRVTARMLIKDEDKKRGGDVLSNMQDIGFLTNSAGIENEIEILNSRMLVRDAVNDLKLHTQYFADGIVKNRLVYSQQPVNVDLDSASLDSLDRYGSRSIRLTLSLEGEASYSVKGELRSRGKTVSRFAEDARTLPFSISTDYGTLTFTPNPEGTYSMQRDLIVTVEPPVEVAKRYLKSMTVAATSKQTTIAELTATNSDERRGIDFLTALVECYNRQANADKNEIALKTEEFINDRIARINEELGNTEGALEDYKRRNTVTRIDMDASQSLQMSSQYSTKLTEINSQIQLLDYLSEYVNNPDNRYRIIPSNVGMSDKASTDLISTYNQAVQDRNRLLRSASELAPQVVSITSTLDELLSSIRTALSQARSSADIQRQSLQGQYNRYQSRLGSTPEQERVLTEIGRQQEVRSGLYLMLLQKREENSISLAATADKGKLIDDVISEGKVSPRGSIIMLAALVLGVGLPLGALFLLSLFRYRVEGREDLMRLTRLPIVADVPVASENVKTAAGIVVQANKNSQIDEVFRSLRTNVLFMMKEHDKTILFTSSNSGEGKTFLAANLAVSFALLGKRVILCGLDIRKPALGKLFGVRDRSQGATAILVKDKVTAEYVRTQITPSGVNDNLDLLLAGPTPPNPTELLARDNLSDMLDILKQEYDYVILDTAPVGLVTDTLQIARFANVCCCVCRADYTLKSDIGMLDNLVKESKLPNACLVLNGIDMSKKKYGYYYGYGSYGKYGRYGYGRYGYGRYGNYGNYGNYADSHYSNKDDDSIKK